MRVVVIGALVGRKGVDVVVSAAARATRGWTVDVIGEGPDRPRLEQQILREAPDRVTLRGFDASAAAAAARYDLLCAPTRGEAGPSLVMMEAMALGRPVVASDVDGSDELIDSQRSGVLVPPDDPTALAAALDALVTAPELRREMGRRARLAVASHFTVDRMVDETLALYEMSSASRPMARAR